MDHKRVIDELTRGKEFAKQLMIHLSDPMSSKESQETLIHGILNSYDKSLSLLSTQGANPNVSKNESGDHEFKDPGHFLAKRKSTNGNMAKWKNQVIIRGKMGFEEALDDGYNWRKYGQKDILGAKHPRGYYRCAYQHVEGCLATKHVQKVVEDPNTFDITYRGIHTCNPGSHTTSTELEIQQKPPQQQNQLTILTGHKVGTKNLETPQFNFPSTSNNIFSLPELETTFDGLTTSGPTYFSMSQPQVSLGEKNTSSMVLESEVNDIVDVGYPFGELEFGNTNNFDDSLLFD